MIGILWIVGDNSVPASETKIEILTRQDVDFDHVRDLLPNDRSQETFENMRLNRNFYIYVARVNFDNVPDRVARGQKIIQLTDELPEITQLVFDARINSSQVAGFYTRYMSTGSSFTGKKWISLTAMMPSDDLSLSHLAKNFMETEPLASVVVGTSVISNGTHTVEAVDLIDWNVMRLDDKSERAFCRYFEKRLQNIPGILSFDVVRSHRYEARQDTSWLRYRVDIEFNDRKVTTEFTFTDQELELSKHSTQITDRLEQFFTELES